MSDVLAFAGVSVVRGGNTLLDDITWEVEEGERWVVLGPNGAGKTTLISILAGLARADAGKLRVMGYDVRAEYADARRSLGVVPQELVFDPFFSVRETLRIQSGYFGLRNNDAWVDEIIERLHLTAKAHANMRQLSGGMKRRVLVAQALVHKPPVIILDEPTAGVDVELRQQLWHFVRELNQAGHTVVLTTHYLEEAEALCSRIAVLKQGRIVALDTTRNLLRGVSGVRLRLRLHPDRLPVAFGNQLVTKDGDSYVLALESYAQIESALAHLRSEGVEVQELEVLQADLEDVFVQIMRKH
jgi:ABC-2 type transport system ATP-binding protein